MHNTLNPSSPMLVDPPQLSVQSASEILDFLYELINAFENHYANQLRRNHQPAEPPEPDLFESLDDDSPPF